MAVAMSVSDSVDDYECDDIYKQEGLGWVRELPENATWTNQDSKPRDDVSTCFAFNL